MKVLVLMGSPRKGDGYNICKLIEDEMDNGTGFEFEYVYLKDLNVEDCRGCDLCFQKGEGYCPIQDDIYNLKQKIIEADGIIFTSPVYAYQVTGSFKRVVDRLSYLFHRPEIVGKPAITLVTTGGGGHKQVTKYLKMIACGWGCNLVGTIEVISPMFFDKKANYSIYSRNYYNKVYRKISNVIREFSNVVKSKELPVPGFYEIYMFNGLRSKTYTSRVDYKYWEKKGWLDSLYYYDTDISPIKKLFGYTMNRIIKHMWNKMQPGEN